MLKVTRIDLLRAAQIVTLQFDKASTKILFKYVDFPNVFSLNLVIKLLRNTGIDKHAMELVNCKQPSYRPICAFSLLELETLKTYIENYLKNGFI